MSCAAAGREPSVFLYTHQEPPNMYPAQAFVDPAMAVALLGIFLTFAIMAGFIWAFKKIGQPPEEHDDNHNGHGA
jgi:hypothetical protein